MGPVASHNYDYIIAGAGAAGMSLVYHLAQAGLTNKRVLLVDRQLRTANDRTWCFWEKAPGPFETLVHMRWRNVSVHDAVTSLQLDLAPYEYKMIRGSAFHRHMNAWVASQPNIDRRFGEVTGITSDGESASICVDGERISADHVFNSILPGDSWLTRWMHGVSPAPENRRDHFLLQHFLGWEIETGADAFDPSSARLMDFRVPQQGETRFVYVLPLSRRRALVEFTVFGPALLPREAYDAGLRSYIARYCALPQYHIAHTEFGVIPMTDAPMPSPQGARVINIGTAGGASKPSSGYTFTRIQRQCAEIARALADGRPPEVTASRTFGLMDRALLEVLAKNRLPGSDVFMRLFARNPASRVLAFLDEDTTLPQTLALMSTVQIVPFAKAMLWSL